jgi:hypothetical protein
MPNLPSMMQCFCRQKDGHVMWLALLESFMISMFAVALISSAEAYDIPPCALPNGVTSTSLENGAPPALLRALKDRVGEIVPPGAPFNPGDVGPGPRRRLIFVWNRDRRWVVAAEFGGRGYFDAIFAYDLSQDGRTATLVQGRGALPHTVCAKASELLDLPESTNTICQFQLVPDVRGAPPNCAKGES